MMAATTTAVQSSFGPASYGGVAPPSIGVGYGPGTGAVMGTGTGTGSGSGARARRNLAQPHPHAHSSEAPAKKQSKWSAEEDTLIIELRGRQMKWDDISKHLPGRSAISCRLHYQNYLERRSEWDEERKNKLARLYERFKPEMWARVAEELQVPWRAAEAMHWKLGETDMAHRAGVTPFSLQPGGPDTPPGTLHHHHRISPSRGHVHSQSQGSAPSSGLDSPGYRRTPVPCMPGRHAPPGPGPGLGPGPGPSSGPLPQHANVRPPMPSGRTLATHRESTIPRNDLQYYHNQLRQPSPQDGYPMPSLGLPPIQSSGQGQGRGAGMLPSVAELTTGISAYDTPAYAMSVPSPSGTASPGPGQLLAPPVSAGYGPPSYYPTTHYEARSGGGGGSASGKRRASPEVMARETSRRRHLDPPGYDDRPPSGGRH